MRGSHLLVGVAAFFLAQEVFAASDFSKSELEAAGKNCIHGYRVELRSVAYYAGKTEELNRELMELADGKDISVPYASHKVVLHVGTKRAESPWDTMPRDSFADWSVTSYDDPADAQKSTPRMHLQVDIWLGSRIKLDDLRIPKRFTVVSGGEIEAYIKSRSGADSVK